MPGENFKSNFMAQRRMFSLKIVDTDAFLDMPVSSQLLYFHLSMRADDDGFVSNPKRIMKMIGSNDDDFKVLITKKFILPFESGVCIIKHWLIHNLIRSDRYTETHYIKEKKMLEIDNSTKKYRLKQAENKDEDINVIPNGNQMTPQVRIGKGRVVNNIDQKKDINIDFQQFWDKYDKKVDREKCEKKWKKLKDQDRQNIINSLDDYINSTPDKQYRKNPSTYLNNKSWENEIVKKTEIINKIKLHDGMVAIKKFGEWRTESGVKIDSAYYPELKNL